MVATENYEMEMAAWERDKADRKSLVRPAPPGFKPSTRGKGIELRLIPARARMRVGQRFWYGLELQNVGSDTVTVTDPLFKDASNPPASDIAFEITPPGGKPERATDFLPDPGNPPGDFTQTVVPRSMLGALH
ncbi:MAG: hypothetical protein KGL53_02015, partial [Elusimicrobia bacterium]|nr:hypothetical protein [Elusimicrobiota bacterium]